MSSDFLITALEATSNVAVLSATLLLVVRYVLQELQSRLYRTKSDESLFTKALSSDDPKVLGDYLYEELGEIDIDKYESDTDIRARLDRYFQKLDEITDKNYGLGSLETDKPAQEVIHPVKSDLANLLDKLDSSLAQSVREDQPWIILYKLRRHLESMLRDRIKVSDRKRVFSLQHLIVEGIRQEVLPKKTLNQLGYALSIANKAIHGENVSEMEAMEAVSNSLPLLEVLQALEHST